MKYQVTYFTYSPALPGQNPWWGPYCEYLDAGSIGEARAIADSRFGECHIEDVREVDDDGQPLSDGGILAQRFAHDICLDCGRDESGHQVERDRYGEPVVRCVHLPEAHAKRHVHQRLRAGGRDD